MSLFGSTFAPAGTPAGTTRRSARTPSEIGLHDSLSFRLASRQSDDRAVGRLEIFLGHGLDVPGRDFFVETEELVQGAGIGGQVDVEGQRPGDAVGCAQRAGQGVFHVGFDVGQLLGGRGLGLGLLQLLEDFRLRRKAGPRRS